MKRLRRLALFLPLALPAGLTLYLHLSDPLNRGYARISDLQAKRGDDPTWSARDLDDSGWTEDFPTEDDLWWLRAEVTLDDDPDPFTPQGISLRISASYELFWDGELMGRNGRVGANAAEEVHGGFNRFFVIPLRLAGAGTHTIAMRLSSFDGYPLSMDFPYVGDLRLLVRQPQTIASAFFVLGGGFLAIAVYSLFRYMICDRRRASLIFAGLCLAIFLLLIVELLRFVADYPYPLQFLRLHTIVILTTAVAYLLPWFLLERFNCPWKRRAATFLALGFAAVWALFGDPDWRTLALVALSFASSFTIALWALAKRREGSREAGLGVAACLLGLGYPGITVFIGLALMAVYTLLSLSIQQRLEREARIAAQTRSLQLETQLLKSRIHPHFLMNTLTSLISWVEEEPKTAVAFIEALGREFALLSEVADRKLIPLGRELALCERHLAVMRLRQEVDYRLTYDGADEEEGVPPALFHTLVENGITHNEPLDGALAFHLHCSRDDHRRIYALTAGGLCEGCRVPDGTGLRYVKSRLQDCFPDRWSLSAGAKAEGWRTQRKSRSPRAAATSCA